MNVRTSILFASILACAITVPLAASGCGGGGDDDGGFTVDCSGDVPSYSELTILDTCTGCHSSELDGVEREGAPEDINFDTYEAAVDSSIDAVGVLSNGSMPPPGVAQPSAAQKQAFYNWAGCDTPQ